MEGGMCHKKLKVSRGKNWSLDDRKDLLEAIKIEKKKIEDKKCDRDALRIKREAWARVMETCEKQYDHRSTQGGKWTLPKIQSQWKCMKLKAKKNAMILQLPKKEHHEKERKMVIKKCIGA